MSDLYILEGTRPHGPVDLQIWSQWFETAERHVAETWVTPDVCVSTVFLGLAHQWGDGPPLLFETMIFGLEDEEPPWRYPTWFAAEQGHERAVAHAQEQVRAHGRRLEPGQ